MAAKRFAACFLRLVLISLLVAYSFSLPLNWRSLNLIKKVNREGPYIGLITVFPPEETAFFQIGAFKPNQKHPFVDLSGRRFLVGKIHDKKVVYVRCGVGMMNAAAATQQMLDLFDILGIANFGIAGNANNSLSIGDVTFPQQFSHTGIWDWLQAWTLKDTMYQEEITCWDALDLVMNNFFLSTGRPTLLGRCFGQILLGSGFMLLPT